MFLRNKYVVNSDLLKVGHNYNQLVVAILAGSTPLSYGIQSGWISPMQKLLQSDSSPSGRPLADGEMTTVATAMTATAVLAGFLHMYTADVHGRKIALIVTLISQALAWIILLISSDVPALVISRICAGVGAAGAFILASMYVKETSRDGLRGTLVSLAICAQYVGILVMYILGSFLNYHTIIWICLSIPMCTIVLVMFVVPETPPFLVKKGKLKEAANVLAYLRGLDAKNDAVLKEVDYLISQDQYFKSISSVNLMDILKNKAWRRACGVAMVTLTFVCFNGTFCIVTYAHSLILEAGIDINPELSTLSVPILMVAGSIVLLICVDNTGRKVVLVGTFLLSTLSLAVLAASFMVEAHGIPFPPYVPVAAMACTVYAYSMGVMTVPHLIISEMLRFEVKAKLMSCIMALAWLILSVSLALYDVLSKLIGVHGVFFMFSCVNLAGAVFVNIFVPETRGRTLEQIEDWLLGKKTTINRC